MDTPAELTLHVIRFLQTKAERPLSPAWWTFVPGFARYRYAEACAFLERADKPLLIGPLHAPPGCAGTWAMGAMSGPERERCDHELRNQQWTLDSMLATLRVPDNGIVRFESWGDTLDVPLPDLRRWIRDYMVMCGWTLGEPTDDSHQARLLIRHTDNTWSPGSVCHPGGPAT